MADGSIIINTEIDSKQAQKELNTLTRKISALSEKLNDLEREKLPLVEQSAQLGANLDAAKATLEHMKSGAEFFTSDSIANQQAQVNAMQKEFDSAALKVETINAKINKTAASLDNAKRKAGELSGQLAGAKNGTRELSPAAEEAGKRFTKLGNRIKGLARRVFVFTLITAALRKIREYMWSAIQTNTDAMAAVAKLKGALRTLAQPIVNIVMIGGFLVVLGIILIFTGVGIPLGIGMLLAGGVSLAAAIAPNWNFIIDKIKYVWQKIKEFWNSYIAPVFTAAWWQNLGKNIMNGLISGIERGINWVLGGVSDMVNGITGILNKIPGVNIGRVNWGNVHIPRLAQGAVIPANREFLAVLGDQKRGTNIEAPADLIRQIVREEVKNSGGVGNHITIVLDSVNGKKIFDTVVKENNAVVRATGASPLVV